MRSRIQRFSLLLAMSSLCVGLATGEPRQTGPVSSNGSTAYSPTESAWLAGHPVVRYSINPEWGPLERVTENGPHGLLVEYLKDIAADTGIHFQFVYAKSWDDALKLFKRGEIDMLPGVAGQSELLDEFGSSLHVIPYYIGATAVITRGDWPVILDAAQLANRRVGVVTGPSESVWLKNRVPAARLSVYPTTEALLDALVRSRIDVALGAEVVMLPLVHRQYRDVLGSAGTLIELPVVLNMVVRPDLLLLHSVLNKAVAHLTALETDRILERWYAGIDFGRPNLSALAAYYWLEGLLVAAVILLCAAIAFLSIRSRHAARRAAAEKTRFLAVMSHEIRTAMNAVVGPLDILVHEPDSRDRNDLIDRARGGSQLLLDTVNALLDLSKLQAGKIPLLRRPAHVEALIDEVIVVYETMAKVKGVGLGRAVAADLIVALDRARYRQILLNLVANAIKFTEHGSIRIEASLEKSPSGTRLLTRVRDTGIGISQAMRCKLFTDYVQAPVSSSSAAQGTGLGLVICKEIVVLMQGRIWMESEPGQGTVVSFDFPADAATLADESDTVSQAPAASALVQAYRPPAPNDPSRSAVLIIDDNPVNRELVARQLSVLGYQARTAESGQAGLDAWRRERQRIVLLDIHLSDMDGYAVARAIRNLEAGQADAASSIFAFSAEVSDEHVKQCIQAGMNRVLTKPVRIEDLRATLGASDDSQSSSRASFEAESDCRADTIDFPAIEMLFYRTSLSDLADMRKAIENQSVTRLADYAHRIKGAALVLGRRGIAELAEQLERKLSSEQVDWIAVQAMWQALKGEVDLIADAGVNSA